MSWRSRWRNLFRQSELDRELEDEMRFHLEARAQDLADRGASPAEAADAARRAFGNQTLLKEKTRGADLFNWADVAARDLRHAGRTLRRNPGFTAVAILSLALGVGANTAMFSVISAVLLQPLPYPEPARLVHPVVEPGHRDNFTMPEFKFLREQAGGSALWAAYRGAGNRLAAYQNVRESIRTVAATDGLLTTLGITPAIGREFTSVEARSRGTAAIILTDGLWKRLFRGEPSAVGRVVDLDGASFTVVGILPEGFWFPQTVDAFVPLQAGNSLDDTGTNTEIIGRLIPGISARQAEADATTVLSRYRQAFPDRTLRGEQAVALPTWQTRLTGGVQQTLLLLFGAVGLLLLISCANLASLLLARLAARQREVAIRLALGSSRQRLLAQHLTENLLLTSLGGTAGLLAAYWLLPLLLSLLPFPLPGARPVTIDGTVLLFTLVIAIATGLTFSLAPLAVSARLDVQTNLRAGVRAAGGSRQRTRSVLVVGEIALAVTLLSAAALLLQSIYRLHQEQLGFSPRDVLVFETPLAKPQRADAAAVARFVERLREPLAAVPVVAQVGAINVLPLTGQSNLPAQRQGHPEQSIGGMEYRIVTPAYFAAMGVPLVRGRGFSSSDSQGALPVVLINETLAHRWWPDGNAVGDRVVVGRFRNREFPDILETPREVVGIVGDTKSVELKASPRPTMYVPLAQTPAVLAQGISSLTWVIRGAHSPGVAPGIRQAVASADTGQQIVRLRPMNDVIAKATAKPRFDAVLLSVFASIALLLTAIGLYGLLSFAVAQRRQEIGIRMALGASRGSVLGLILRQGGRLVLAGLALGLTGAVSTSRLLNGMLHGVKPADPASLTAVAALLFGVGLLASFLPARRATQVDPVTALRYE